MHKPPLSRHSRSSSFPNPFRRSRAACAALATAALSLPACAPDDTNEGDTKTEILYTEYGMAHIRADDYESLGLAHGYAQARDNACAIELGMLGFNAELSRHFGPDAPGNSLVGANDALGSDLYFQGLKDSRAIESLVAEAPPLGPRPEVRELVRGYVLGFNRLLAEAPAIDCIDAEWLRPMTELDVYRKVFAVSTLLGQGGAAGAIVSAAPPVASANTRSSTDPVPAVTAESRRVTEHLGRPGSNGMALGADATATGYGMNVANPHLKWDGDMRWWQTQLTIPGTLDVSGAGLTGMPLIVMGHTETVAFSITATEQTQHFTLFELTLQDGSPTTYLVDGNPEAMQRRDVTVQVKRPNGELELVTEPQWWTRYGPVIGPEFGLPWSAGDAEGPGRAFVVADPNANNLRMLNLLFGLDHARDVGDVLAAIRDTQAAPWWTIMAADANGEALFSQIQVVANVSDAHLERCLSPIGRAVIEGPDHRIILDGSRSECAWQDDADAVQPGTFGPGGPDSPRMPLLRSSGYVANSNASHWMPSADERIAGMPRIIGDEGTQRPLRTRQTLTAIEEQLAESPFTRQAMQDLVLSNRSHAAELGVDDTLVMCERNAERLAASSEGQDVDLTAACNVLSSWDRRMDPGSRGALLFDRYWRRANELAGSEGVELLKRPFELADPLHTPAELDIDGDVFSRALSDAVLELEAAHMSLSAPLGEHQYVVRNGRRIPLGGGGGPDGLANLGVFNILDAPWNPESGYTGSFSGSTYMHVVSFDGTPCPDVATLLTYSQSSEPSSPHYSDQTELYSQKRWVTGRFCEADILDSPELERIEL